MTIDDLLAGGRQRVHVQDAAIRIAKLLEIGGRVRRIKRIEQHRLLRGRQIMQILFAGTSHILIWRIEAQVAFSCVNCRRASSSESPSSSASNAANSSSSVFPAWLS